MSARKAWCAAGCAVLLAACAVAPASGPIPAPLEGRSPLPPLPVGAEAAPNWPCAEARFVARQPGVLRFASYNIKHGRGMDDKLDLARTAAALARLDADVIALQEVDLEVRRSGSVHEPQVLGLQLGMHACFGAFMDYQGGRYGMAILSKLPIERSFALRLPDGNEPRVALVAELRAPAGELLTVVDVHFDWVQDDGFRLAQAARVAEYLRTLSGPFVLLGDCNDEPGSRTIDLLATVARPVAKPAQARLTFPADRPHKEIDFVFVGPTARWAATRAWVVEEPSASDHRPVLAELTLR